MAKYKYTTEFEVNASVNMLYPYFSTATGLKEWFADDVNMESEKKFVFEWQGELKPARMVIKRTNQHVKFQFDPVNEADEHDLAYVEFKMDYNELTQSTFIKVIDYSEMDDEIELDEMWGQFFDDLKKQVGA
ncbi:START-like domain-containing protein [Limibacter armeniacum]|uniref:START-like domain-containing protein n=1 Tax=Limibacter armeniacum TaxID=466084 RepID=UPI002FE62EEA